MKLILTSTLIAALVFLIIDIIWLSLSVKTFYGPRIGHLFTDKPVMWAAAMFYIVYVLALSVVIIEPSINNNNTLQFLFKAFMFGFAAYGTYNLTNMAVLKDWSPSVVIVDMFWGGSLTAFSSYVGVILAKKLLL